ncbi:GlcG/HbpS family heme-binding protein [Yinghuangia seranimata]|uniref:GlcG/HbpS family heme-binding protein n=1 Tax=Yinghuangia seranimata TaxID=408067 RepID=UPI00248B1D67|nr:heme-binding protein [Yinghuangia seranimata]MDI2132753.1 heme-binding protein [Yinghuangia seranimata]
MADDAVVVGYDVGDATARAMVERVVARARATGRAVTVAVVDSAGVLVAFARMDGALRFSAGLATEKARTAASFGRPTAFMESMMAERPVFAQSFTNQGNWYLGRGGYPLLHDGKPVGGIGVSGDEADFEDDLAREEAEAFGG